MAKIGTVRRALFVRYRAMKVGTVRRALFVPWQSRWNAIVRDLTAWLGRRGWFDG